MLGRNLQQKVVVAISTLFFMSFWGEYLWAQQVPAECAQPVALADTAAPSSELLGQMALVLAEDLAKGLPQEKLTMLQTFSQDQRPQEMIWVLNKNHLHKLSAPLEQVLEKHMMNAKVVAGKSLGGGATDSYLVTLEDGIKVVFKPYSPGLTPKTLSTNVRSEVGAYRIDKMLDINLVPHTVMRFLQHKDLNGGKKTFGSLQYFVKNSIPPKKAPVEKRVRPQNMYFLDYFDKNPDRHKQDDSKYEQNYLYNAELDQMVAIDNGWALRSGNVMATMLRMYIDKRTPAERKRQFSTPPEHRLYENLLNFTPAKIKQELKGILSPRVIRKLILRRVKMLKNIERMYAAQAAAEGSKEEFKTK